MRSVAWSPPASDILKHNFDGNCVCELGLAGYGGVIRNDSGDTLLSYAGPLSNGLMLDVELYASWRGVLALVELGEVGSILEGGL